MGNLSKKSYKIRDSVRTSNRESGKSLVSIVLGSLLFIALSIFVVSNAIKSIVMAYKRNELLDQAREEVAELRLENLELSLDKEEILDLDFVEEQARDKLYYVSDGEVMVVLPENLEDNLEVLDSLEEEDVLQGIDRWISLVKDGV